MQTLEGSDFFTASVSEALENGEADIAVHSLKDMSYAHFSGGNVFAVIDRDDPRDIALIHPDAAEKLRKGETLIAGTCSPRREEMALDFLTKALPRLHPDGVKITVRPVRGNVETRLQKLDSGEYDLTLLATAGLNRLLRSEKDGPLIRSLLAGKRKMLLPLIECVPAPCQGAIVAEASPRNPFAASVVRAINDPLLYATAKAEKETAIHYGSGCEQRFGVTTISAASGPYRYAAGVDATGNAFSAWEPLPAPVFSGNLFSGTDHMRDLFNTEWLSRTLTVQEPVVFAANYKMARDPQVLTLLQQKRIFTSGTRTWFELAKKGCWVEGCADGLGLVSFLPVLSMPLFEISIAGLHILTHQQAAQRWNKKGYKASAIYKLNPANNPVVYQGLEQASAVFWSSYAQFELYGSVCGADVVHLCPGGETATGLHAAGINPVIFPTIKAFELWRSSLIR